MNSNDLIPSFNVLGVRVHVVRMAETLLRIKQWIDSGQGCHFVVATGMHGVIEAHKNPAFKEILNSADLFVPDGYSLIWTARRRGHSITHRVCGTDLMSEFIAISESEGYRNFFYGDTEETLDRMVTKLKEEFPKLKIVGAHSPPFRSLSSAEEAREIQIINDSGADIIWVGLGLPKQEYWIHRHRDVLKVPVAVGVGAAFKFHSGQVRRAPDWIGEKGFEWLWRLIQEPKRVWKRALVDGPRFVFCVALELIGIKKYE